MSGLLRDVVAAHERQITSFDQMVEAGAPGTGVVLQFMRDQQNTITELVELVKAQQRTIEALKL